MSQNLYVPDQGARDTWVEPIVEAFRTQRDLSLLIPINFITNAAVSLRAACFSHNQYDDEAFRKCFSNLLAVGLRRFHVDIYWDSSRSEWSLCPAEVPPSGSSNQTTTVLGSASGTASSSSSTIESNGSETTGVTSTTPSTEGASAVRPRQEETPATQSSSSVSSSISATSANPTPSVVRFETSDGNPFFQIGRYNCTSTMTLRFLTGIFEDFLDATSTTTDATFTYLSLNIHAAASMQSPNDPAQKPSSDSLPGAGNLISNIVRGNLSDEMYTPGKLQDQRSNLGDSWFDVDRNNHPADAYYQTSKDSSGNIITQDGWPTEAYIEFKEHYRLISSFGTIDPQMADYNITADATTIFTPGSMNSDHSHTFSEDGKMSSGCLFAPNEDSITSTTNSSWAIAAASNINVSATPNFLDIIPSITNLTSCGFSPLLNSSLANTTADKNPLPYAAFVHSTLWSWAPGQPQNATTPRRNPTRDRCAIIYASQPFPGRWVTIDCNERRHVACHNPSTPYNWTISSTTHTYFTASSACTKPYIFSAPHTALENAHLLSAMSTLADRNAPVFIDLNSLDVVGCWVVGANGTCPYIPTTDTNRTRLVVVPTVAAVIIFVLSALTFFVKCASNRREDHRGRRRRMVDGWEYEGVPS